MAWRSINDRDAGAVFQPPPTPALHRTDGHSSRPGLRALVGGVTIRNNGKSPENQDAYVSGQSSSGTKCFVGVFDGHGERGKNISHFARDTLSRTFLDHPELHSNPRSALEAAYAEAENQISRRHRAEAEYSGTTAVSAYQHRDKLWVANVGDSRAVLARRDNAGNLEPVELSSDHKPSRSDEKQRILAAGGKVDQSMFPMDPAGRRWMKAGPERVMDKSGMGGLAVSRSLGDLALKPWVCSRPEIVERRLDGSDQFLVLGSDGIWDHISSKEAVEIVGKHGDPAQAAQKITDVAKQRWHRETGGQVSDDITAVVVRLEGDHAPPTPTGMLSPKRGHGRPLSSPQISSPLGSASPGQLGRSGKNFLPVEMLSPLGNRSLALDTLRKPIGQSGNAKLSRHNGRGSNSRPASTGALRSVGQ